MPHEIIKSYYNNWTALSQAQTVRPVIELTIDFGALNYNLYSSRTASPLGSNFVTDGSLVDISFPRENILREIQSWSCTVATTNASLKNSILAARHYRLPTSTNIDVPLGFLGLWFLNTNDTEDSQSNLVVGCGLMDTCEIIEGGDQMIATLNFWNGPDHMWDEVPHIRMTPDFQKKIPLASSIPASPVNDKGFDYVPLLQNWTFFWGKGKGSGGSGTHKHKGKHKHKRA